MIYICGFCRRMRPMHAESCVYVGAIRWHDALGGQAQPKLPWLEIDYDLTEKDLKGIGMGETDISTYLRLCQARENQPSLPGATRIAEV